MPYINPYADVAMEPRREIEMAKEAGRMERAGMRLGERQAEYQSRQAASQADNLFRLQKEDLDAQQKGWYAGQGSYDYDRARAHAEASMRWAREMSLPDIPEPVLEKLADADSTALEALRMHAMGNPLSPEQYAQVKPGGDYNTYSQTFMWARQAGAAGPLTIPLNARAQVYERRLAQQQYTARGQKIADELSANLSAIRSARDSGDMTLPQYERSLQEWLRLPSHRELRAHVVKQPTPNEVVQQQAVGYDQDGQKYTLNQRAGSVQAKPVPEKKPEQKPNTFRPPTRENDHFQELTMLPTGKEEVTFDLAKEYQRLKKELTTKTGQVTEVPSRAQVIAEMRELYPTRRDMIDRFLKAGEHRGGAFSRNGQEADETARLTADENFIDQDNARVIGQAKTELLSIAQQYPDPAKAPPEVFERFQRLRQVLAK